MGAFYGQAPSFLGLKLDDPSWVYVANLVISRARWVCTVYNLWCTWYPADLIYPMLEHRIAFCIARHDWVAFRPVSVDHLKYWVKTCVEDRDEVLKLAAAREHGEGQWIWISEWNGLGRVQQDTQQGHQVEAMDSGRLHLRGGVRRDENGMPKPVKEGGFWVDASWNRAWAPGAKKSKALWTGGKRGIDGVVSLGSKWMCGLYKGGNIPECEFPTDS